MVRQVYHSAALNGNRAQPGNSEHGADVYFKGSCVRMERLQSILSRLATRENLWALAFCLMLIALVILTADTSPQWIYQGF